MSTLTTYRSTLSLVTSWNSKGCKLHFIVKLRNKCRIIYKKNIICYSLQAHTVHRTFVRACLPNDLVKYAVCFGYKLLCLNLCLCCLGLRCKCCLQTLLIQYETTTVDIYQGNLLFSLWLLRLLYKLIRNISLGNFVFKQN